MRRLASPRELELMAGRIAAGGRNGKHILARVAWQRGNPSIERARHPRGTEADSDRTGDREERRIADLLDDIRVVAIVIVVVTEAKDGLPWFKPPAKAVALARDVAREVCPRQHHLNDRSLLRHQVRI